jgi:hypothetical protein
MVLSFVRRWLGTLLKPRKYQCGSDFGVEKHIPSLPSQSLVDFVRRAPLTRPSSPNSVSNYGSSSTSYPNSHSTSLLTILPPEIRCQIWKEVVGGHSFYLIVDQSRRLTGWRSGFANPSTCDEPRPRAYRRPTPTLSEELWERKNILALLLTCRRT